MHHLGSTSIIVDTYTGTGGPRVVQRQYHKPYGEVAWQSMGTAGSLTSIGYTGQRQEEDSGLMFYNARFYDPALSYFVSADTIAPDKGDPKSRNRYSYVLNNPLKYTDPSGHCTNPAQGSAEQRNGKTCESAQERLRLYGINVSDMTMWDLNELYMLIDAIWRMMATFGWTTIEEFREAMGIDSLGAIWLNRVKGPGAGGLYCGALADCDRTHRQGKDGKRIIAIIGSPEAYANGLEEMGQIMVHELAHAWDHAAGYAPSGGMARRTGSYETDEYYYAGGDAASEYGGSGDRSYGKHGKREDWAEAVAASVYPHRARFRPVWGTDPRTGEHRIGMDYTRQAHVKQMGQIVTNTVNNRRRFYGGQ